VPEGETVQEHQDEIAAIFKEASTVEGQATRLVDFASTGDGPRHLVISPDGRYLYVTNNASGTVSKVDARTGRVLRSVATGNQPRSMAISGDGRAVYVVNYESSTVSKLRASDLGRLGEVATDQHPIGITYEPTTRSAISTTTPWESCLTISTRRTRTRSPSESENSLRNW